MLLLLFQYYAATAAIAAAAAAAAAASEFLRVGVSRWPAAVGAPIALPCRSLLLKRSPVHGCVQLLLLLLQKGDTAAVPSA